jgi:acetate CoA/acetoacetate CoA-transferase alpha subunit
MPVNKIMKFDEAMSYLKNGVRLMIGDFVGSAEPTRSIQWILDNNISDITLITNTPGWSGFGKAMLYKNGCIKELIASHVGTTAESTKEYLEDKLVVKQFFPMGTWAEKVRAGGVGIGGVLIPVGIGILDEEGLFGNVKKRKIVLENGKEYIVEDALTADISIVKGYRADRYGNVECRFTSRNNQKDLAMAGKFTIVEVNEIVEVGTIPPENISIPGPFVQAVVQGLTFDEQQKLYRDRWVEIGKLPKN